MSSSWKPSRNNFFVLFRLAAFNKIYFHLYFIALLSAEINLFGSSANIVHKEKLKAKKSSDDTTNTPAKKVDKHDKPSHNEVKVKDEDKSEKKLQDSEEKSQKSESTHKHHKHKVKLKESLSETPSKVKIKRDEDINKEDMKRKGSDVVGTSAKKTEKHKHKKETPDKSEKKAADISSKNTISNDNQSDDKLSTPKTSHSDKVKHSSKKKHSLHRLRGFLDSDSNDTEDEEHPSIPEVNKEKV